jgi:copper chaperone CopZ
MIPIRLIIEDVGSAGSPEAVESALAVVPGVMSVHIDPAGVDVLVEAGENVDPDALILALQKIGCVATLAG